MTHKKVRLTLNDLRRIISEVIQESSANGSLQLKEERKSTKDKTDQRKVIDGVRVAISDAITDDIRKNVHAQLKDKALIRYSDIEIISEPPKTLVRFMDIDGIPGQDMIYLVNVTKIV